MSVLTVPAAVRHIHGDHPGRAAIGADTLRKWAADGTVPAMLTGRGWVFATEALDEWMRTFGTHERDGPRNELVPSRLPQAHRATSRR